MCCLDIWDNQETLNPTFEPLSLLWSWRQGTLDKPLLLSKPGLVLAHPGEVALLSGQPVGLFKQANHIPLWELGYLTSLILQSQPRKPCYSLCSQAQLPGGCVMCPVLSQALSLCVEYTTVSFSFPMLGVLDLANPVTLQECLPCQCREGMIKHPPAAYF